jgi:hypothetical protein
MALSTQPTELLLPGFGMTEPGAPGELLIGPPFLGPLLSGSAWAGPGLPAEVLLAIPDDPFLAGLSFHGQGLLADPSGHLGLTQGIEIQLVLSSGCTLSSFDPSHCTGSCSGTCLLGASSCRWAWSALQYAVDIAVGAPCPGWGCVCP